MSDCLGPKKGTSILIRVAKLLRLSIYIFGGALPMLEDGQDFFFYIFYFEKD